MSAPLDYQNRGRPSAAPIPGARAALILLLSINMFNYVDRMVLAAVESQIGDTYFTGANAEHALEKTGLLATAFLVSYLITAPIFGWLADRMSRWFLVGLSVIIWSLASGASGLAGTFTILLFTRCFVGIGEAGYGPSAPTLISDFYPISRRGEVLAWFYAAIPVGSALGYILGGFVAKHWGWRMAFYVVVPPGLLLGIISFLMRSPPRGQADLGASAKSARSAKLADYLLLLRNPSYLLDCAGMTAMTFAIGGISYFMPRYLLHRGAGDLQQVNFYFGMILVIAGLAATLAGGWTGDKLRERYSGSYFLVSAIGIAISAPLILLLLITPFPAAWGVIFLIVFFLFFNTGPSNTILANVTHPSIRASAFALNIFLIHILGDAFSPWLLGHIIGPIATPNGLTYHWTAAMILVTVVMCSAALFWGLGVRYLQRDTERASAPLPATN
ncbi:MAG TPA: MFS transporter [Tepidisphaeraceae bacterium]|jgi:MFS family permease